MSASVQAPPADSLSADSVLAGLIDRATLARALKCSERTVIRLAPPKIRLGGRVLYNVETVRAWLLDHEQRRTEPRRGRPPVKRAA